MRIQFTRSARRHKIGRAHVLFVMRAFEQTDNGINARGLAEREWNGRDDRGVMLRILAVIVDDGQTLLVFHVQPDYNEI